MEDIAVESPRPKVSALAVWSLVLGILSAIGFCFTGIPAIICGAIGLKKIGDSNGMLTGKGLAIAGIVCGVVLMLFSIVLASLAMPAYNQITQKAQLAKTMSDVNQISLASRSWAADNNGNYPANLEQLVPDYLAAAILQTHSGEPFHYIDGFKDSDPAMKVLIYSDAISTGSKTRVIGTVGGTVETVSEEEFEAALAR